MKPGFNLFSQPPQGIQLLRYGNFRVLADHHAWEIGDVRPQSMDVPVSFSQNLDVQFYQTFKAPEPLPPVRVRIGGL